MGEVSTRSILLSTLIASGSLHPLQFRHRVVVHLLYVFLSLSLSVVVVVGSLPPYKHPFVLYTPGCAVWRPRKPHDALQYSVLFCFCCCFGVLIIPLVVSIVLAPFSAFTDFFDLPQETNKKRSIEKDKKKYYSLQKTTRLSNLHQSTIHIYEEHFSSVLSPARSLAHFNSHCLLMPSSTSITRPEESPAQFVVDMLEQHPVVIISATYCTFCTKLKRLLIDLKHRFVALEINLLPNGRKVFDEVMRRTQCHTVPQVFIHGQYVGGYDDGARELQKYGGGGFGEEEVYPLTRRADHTSVNARGVPLSRMAEGTIGYNGHQRRRSENGDECCCCKGSDHIQPKTQRGTGKMGLLRLFFPLLDGGIQQRCIDVFTGEGMERFTLSLSLFFFLYCILMVYCILFIRLFQTSEAPKDVRIHHPSNSNNPLRPPATAVIAHGVRWHSISYLFFFLVFFLFCLVAFLTRKDKKNGKELLKPRGTGDPSLLCYDTVIAIGHHHFLLLLFGLFVCFFGFSTAGCSSWVDRVVPEQGIFLLVKLYMSVLIFEVDIFHLQVSAPKLTQVAFNPSPHKFGGRHRECIFAIIIIITLLLPAPLSCPSQLRIYLFIIHFCLFVCFQPFYLFILTRFDLILVIQRRLLSFSLFDLFTGHTEGHTRTRTRSRPVLRLVNKEFLVCSLEQLLHLSSRSPAPAPADSGCSVASLNHGGIEDTRGKELILFIIIIIVLIVERENPHTVDAPMGTPEVPPSQVLPAASHDFTVDTTTSTRVPLGSSGAAERGLSVVAPSSRLRISPPTPPQRPPPLTATAASRRRSSRVSAGPAPSPPLGPPQPSQQQQPLGIGARAARGQSGPTGVWYKVAGASILGSPSPLTTPRSFVATEWVEPHTHRHTTTMEVDLSRIPQGGTSIGPPSHASDALAPHSNQRRGSLSSTSSTPPRSPSNSSSRKGSISVSHTSQSSRSSATPIHPASASFGGRKKLPPSARPRSDGIGGGGGSARGLPPPPHRDPPIRNFSVSSTSVLHGAPQPHSSVTPSAPTASSAGWGGLGGSPSHTGVRYLNSGNSLLSGAGNTTTTTLSGGGAATTASDSGVTGKISSSISPPSSSAMDVGASNVNGIGEPAVSFSTQQQGSRSSKAVGGRPHLSPSAGGAQERRPSPPSVGGRHVERRRSTSSSTSLGSAGLSLKMLSVESSTQSVGVPQNNYNASRSNPLSYPNEVAIDEATTGPTAAVAKKFPLKMEDNSGRQRLGASRAAMGELEGESARSDSSTTGATVSTTTHLGVGHLSILQSRPPSTRLSMGIMRNQSIGQQQATPNNQSPRSRVGSLDAASPGGNSPTSPPSPPHFWRALEGKDGQQPSVAHTVQTGTDSAGQTGTTPFSSPHSSPHATEGEASHATVHTASPEPHLSSHRPPQQSKQKPLDGRGGGGLDASTASSTLDTLMMVSVSTTHITSGVPPAREPGPGVPLRGAIAAGVSRQQQDNGRGGRCNQETEYSESDGVLGPDSPRQQEQQSGTSGSAVHRPQILRPYIVSSSPRLQEEDSICCVSLSPSPSASAQRGIASPGSGALSPPMTSPVQRGAAPLSFPNAPAPPTVITPSTAFSTEAVNSSVRLASPGLSPSLQQPTGNAAAGPAGPDTSPPAPPPAAAGGRGRVVCVLDTPSSQGSSAITSASPDSSAIAPTCGSGSGSRSQSHSGLLRAQQQQQHPKNSGEKQQSRRHHRHHTRHCSHHRESDQSPSRQISSEAEGGPNRRHTHSHRHSRGEYGFRTDTAAPVSSGSMILFINGSRTGTVSGPSSRTEAWGTAAVGGEPERETNANGGRGSIVTALQDGVQGPQVGGSLACFIPQGGFKRPSFVRRSGGSSLLNSRTVHTMRPPSASDVCPGGPSTGATPTASLSSSPSQDQRSPSHPEGSSATSSASKGCQSSQQRQSAPQHASTTSPREGITSDEDDNVRVSAGLQTCSAEEELHPPDAPKSPGIYSPLRRDRHRPPVPHAPDPGTYYVENSTDRGAPVMLMSTANPEDTSCFVVARSGVEGSGGSRGSGGVHIIIPSGGLDTQPSSPTPCYGSPMGVDVLPSSTVAFRRLSLLSAQEANAIAAPTQSIDLPQLAHVLEHPPDPPGSASEDTRAVLDAEKAVARSMSPIPSNAASRTSSTWSSTGSSCSCSISHSCSSCGRSTSPSRSGSSSDDVRSKNAGTPSPRIPGACSSTTSWGRQGPVVLPPGGEGGGNHGAVQPFTGTEQSSSGTVGGGGGPVMLLAGNLGNGRPGGAYLLPPPVHLITSSTSVLTCSDEFTVQRGSAAWPFFSPCYDPSNCSGSHNPNLVRLRHANSSLTQQHSQNPAAPSIQSADSPVKCLRKEGGTATTPTIATFATIHSTLHNTATTPTGSFMPDGSGPDQLRSPNQRPTGPATSESGTEGVVASSGSPVLNDPAASAARKEGEGTSPSGIRRVVVAPGAQATSPMQLCYRGDSFSLYSVVQRQPSVITSGVVTSPTSISPGTNMEETSSVNHSFTPATASKRLSSTNKSISSHKSPPEEETDVFATPTANRTRNRSHCLHRRNEPEPTIDTVLLPRHQHRHSTNSIALSKHSAGMGERIRSKGSVASASTGGGDGSGATSKMSSSATSSGNTNTNDPHVPHRPHHHHRHHHSRATASVTAAGVHPPAHPPHTGSGIVHFMGARRRDAGARTSPHRHKVPPTFPLSSVQTGQLNGTSDGVVPPDAASGPRHSARGKGSGADASASGSGSSQSQQHNNVADSRALTVLLSGYGHVEGLDGARMPRVLSMSESTEGGDAKDQLRVQLINFESSPSCGLDPCATGGDSRGGGGGEPLLGANASISKTLHSYLSTVAGPIRHNSFSPHPSPTWNHQNASVASAVSSSVKGGLNAFQLPDYTLRMSQAANASIGASSSAHHHHHDRHRGGHTESSFSQQASPSSHCTSRQGGPAPHAVFHHLATEDLDNRIGRADNSRGSTPSMCSSREMNIARMGYRAVSPSPLSSTTMNQRDVASSQANTNGVSSVMQTYPIVHILRNHTDSDVFSLVSDASPNANGPSPTGNVAGSVRAKRSGVRSSVSNSGSTGALHAVRVEGSPLTHLYSTSPRTSSQQHEHEDHRPALLSQLSSEEVDPHRVMTPVASSSPLLQDISFLTSAGPNLFNGTSSQTIHNPFAAPLMALGSEIHQSSGSSSRNMGGPQGGVRGGFVRHHPGPSHRTITPSANTLSDNSPLLLPRHPAAATAEEKCSPIPRSPTPTTAGEPPSPLPLPLPVPPGNCRSPSPTRQLLSTNYSKRGSNVALDAELNPILPHRPQSPKRDRESHRQKENTEGAEDASSEGSTHNPLALQADGGGGGGGGYGQKTHSHTNGSGSVGTGPTIVGHNSGPSSCSAHTDTSSDTQSTRCGVAPGADARSDGEETTAAGASSSTATQGPQVSQATEAGRSSSSFPYSSTPRGGGSNHNSGGDSGGDISDPTYHTVQEGTDRSSRQTTQSRDRVAPTAVPSSNDTRSSMFGSPILPSTTPIHRTCALPYSPVEAVDSASSDLAQQSTQQMQPSMTPPLPYAATIAKRDSPSTQLFQREGCSCPCSTASSAPAVGADAATFSNFPTPGVERQSSFDDVGASPGPTTVTPSRPASPLELHSSQQPTAFVAVAPESHDAHPQCDPSPPSAAHDTRKISTSSSGSSFPTSPTLRLERNESGAGIGGCANVRPGFATVVPATTAAALHKRAFANRMRRQNEVATSGSAGGLSPGAGGAHRRVYDAFLSVVVDGRVQDGGTMQEQQQKPSSEGSKGVAVVRVNSRPGSSTAPVAVLIPVPPTTPAGEGGGGGGVLRARLEAVPPKPAKRQIPAVVRAVRAVKVKNKNKDRDVKKLYFNETNFLLSFNPLTHPTPPPYKKERKQYIKSY
eukprot:gene5746-4107_t